ncbi:hypothetical protein KEM52_003559 [Ascosphaera acerosa]|nr:hypothetical protein KEM52_003559 [Ascosphaera acerosa]
MDRPQVELTRENVVDALLAAAGNSPEQIAAVTELMHEWEVSSEYHEFLQDAFMDYSLPLAVRHLAIIQLKHGVDRYWRKLSPHAFSADVKQAIKTRAVEAGALEPDARLALQNALLVARIIRQEFPVEWPNAVTGLLHMVRSSMAPGVNPLQLQRVLLMMLRVIKELSTVRMPKTQKALCVMANEMLQVFASIYSRSLKEGMDVLSVDPGSATSTLNVSLLSLKLLRRIMICTYEHPNRDPAVQEVWALILDHFSTIYGHISTKASKPAPEIQLLLRKHLLQMSKLHSDMIVAHPAAFVLLPNAVGMVQSYWGLVVELGQTYGISDISQIGTGEDFMDEQKTFQEKLALRGLLILRSCVRLAFFSIQSFKYPMPEDKDEKNHAVSIIRSQVLSDNFVIEVMELLVTKYFRYNASDLEMWQDDPEEWERMEDEISDAWEFSIRPCAEKLFLDIVINFKALLVPRLMNVFQTYAVLENDDILLKDSIYCAIGLAAPVLESQLDFNTFLESVVLQEVTRQAVGQNIIRRRISILLGEWVPVIITRLKLANVYQTFQHLLCDTDAANDLVVRLTAARQLRVVLEPFENDRTLFANYLTPILTSVLTLLERSTLVQTKMGLLETVRVVVVKMDTEVAPFTDRIISLLPGLWELAGEEYLMKQAILTLLATMMHSLREGSARYQSLIMPLVQQSCEPGSDSSSYLLEEALDLWEAVLVQAPPIATPEVLALVPCLFKIFDAEVDGVLQALDITRSYLYLAPGEMLLDDVRVPLLSCLNKLLHLSAKDRIGAVPLLGEQLICAVRVVQAGNEQALRILAGTMVETGFLPSILAGLRDAYEANQTTGPNRKTSPIFGVMETDYFSVLAQLALDSPRVFLESVAAACPGQTQEQAMKWLLAEWFAHYDSVYSVPRKKLHVLALTRLLSINGTASPPPPFLLNELQSYLTCWTDLIFEVGEVGKPGEDDGYDSAEERPLPGGDYLVSTYDVTDTSNWARAPEVMRQVRWEKLDPVGKINTYEFVLETLRGVIQVCGGPAAFNAEWLVNVDADVVKQGGWQTSSRRLD